MLAFFGFRGVDASQQTQDIGNIEPGQTLNFPAAGHYPAMNVRCTATNNLQQPSPSQRERCETVVERFTADTVNNTPRVSTYSSSGNDRRVDVRLDNEGVIVQDGVHYARFRIQANGVQPSPTFAVILAETSPRRGHEGPFFGQNRLRAALRASLRNGGTVWLWIERRVQHDEL